MPFFQGIKEFFVPSKTKDNAQKEKKRKQKKTKQKLIRRVWGQVRSPFGQPHLTFKPCKPNQKHKHLVFPPTKRAQKRALF